MSDFDLLVFGCVVTFVFLAGVYIYARECFQAAGESSIEPRREKGGDAEKDPLREVA